MANLLKTITKKEKIFLAVISLLVILVMAVPYLYGYFSAPDNTVYTGVHHLTPGDTNVFQSMIEQTKQGNNIFINLYTSEAQQRLYVNPLWLSVGWLAKIFDLSSLLALHLARSLWIIIFIIVLYLFIAYFFKSKSKRKWVLLLVLFSSGLGVFFNPFLFDVNNIYEHPTDIWVSESITFLTLYHSPHLIASLTLIVLIFLLMLLAFEYNKKRYSISAGVACLFLLWFHPFNGPTVYLVLGTYLLVLMLWQRKIIKSYIKHFLILCIIPVPAVVYLYLISRADWVIRTWAAQNILPSPSVWMYIIGYGFILLFAFLGVWITFKKADNKKLFLVIWAIFSAMLLYIPLSFQRRMSEGLHIPLSILAFFGIYYLYKKIKTKRELYGYSLIMFLIIFLPLTNFQILGQDIYLYTTKKDLPYYLYEEEVAAMGWLKNNIGEKEIIFSSFYMGNYIPAHSGRIVWIGHGPQTIDLPTKYQQSEWFWQSDNEILEKRNFLQDNAIDYIFYGRKEKELGTYNPATKEYLEQVFINSKVEIYKVL